MTIDPSSIDPDAIYTVESDSGGEPAIEIDTGTGEVTEFDRGPEVRQRERMTGRQLLERLAAAERTRATGKPQAVAVIVNDTELAADGEVLIETDDAVPPKKGEDR